MRNKTPTQTTQTLDVQEQTGGRIATHDKVELCILWAQEMEGCPGRARERREVSGVTEQC